MLQFNEIRIATRRNSNIDEKYLYVDVSSLHAEGDSPLQINHIYIGFGTNETTQDFITIAAVEEGNLNARLELPLTDIPSEFQDMIPNGAEKMLIYVKVTVDSNSTSYTQDCPDSTEIIGFAYDKCLLLNSVFSYLKDSENECNDFNALANYITQVRGLELAIETGNFTLASNYWNKFFSKNRITQTNGCLCGS